MTLKEYCSEIESFLKQYLADNHQDMYVLGLSGGVDSSLMAAIAKKAVGKDKLMCIMMPIESNEADLKDGIKVAEALDVNYLVLDASKAYNELKQLFIISNEELDISTLSNLKVRMRMSMLYAYAQKHHALVLGTDNMDERYVGYFTKYGDGAADVLPIVYLTKAEVREAAEIYGVSKALALRVPSAGLFEGQTDEGEMGVSYADLDAFLLGKEIAPEAKAKIEHMHAVSEHKRVDIPTPAPFKR